MPLSTSVPRIATKTRRSAYGLMGRVVLGTLALAGIMSLALVAPNAAQAFRVLEGVQRTLNKRRTMPADVRVAVKRLHKRGFVRVYQRRGETMVALTDRGRRELLRYTLQKRSLERRKWDGRWRMIIFDIEERRRGVRDRLRQEMQALGFVRLQDSVWVYPHECEEVIAMLKADHQIARNLLYIVAADIERDEWLKKRFGLAAD